MSETDGIGDRAAHRTGPSSTASPLAESLVRIAEDAAEDLRTAAGETPQSPAVRRARDEERQRVAQAGRAGADATGSPARFATRAPAPADHRRERDLLNRMRRAQDRGVEILTQPAAVPPGRMDAGELVRRSAQRAARVRRTAQPWEQRVRRRRPTPKLVVGIAADISGSQQPVMAAVGEIGWLLGRVVHQRGGRAATVLWNHTAAVMPTLRGAQVPVPQAGGGSDGLPDALRALDGLLKLTTDSSPRLLAILTDGLLPNPEPVHREVQRLIGAGVRVLWLLTQDYEDCAITPPSGVVVGYIERSHRIPTVIADAAVAALRAQ